MEANMRKTADTRRAVNKIMSASLDQRLLDVALRNDFGAFAVRAFQTVTPGTPYLHGWHLDALAHALMQVHKGQVRRLIINQPPRSLKSLYCSVAYVAWVLGNDPTRRFICVSYSTELAATFQRQFRSVVGAEWYRRAIPRFQLVKETENECVTNRGGGRWAVSVDGTITGRGGHVIIIDDPLKAESAASVAERRKLEDWFTNTLLSRPDDKATAAIILVAQRLHEDDLAGYLLRQGGWRHLNLPAIALDDETVAIGPTANHYRKKGDPLHPERESLELLEELKGQMGSSRFYAQYLQQPIPAQGNLIRRREIREYDRVPEGEVVQSWDIASSTGDRNDYSVCTTWVVAQRRYYLVDVWRGRLEFPHQRRKLIELSRQHQPNTLLIERAGPGLHMLQELQVAPQRGVPEPIGIQPEGDKTVRMEAQASRFEAGQVHLPKEAPWLSEFLLEILAFPRSKHDDQIDSMSQFLNWAEQRHRFSDSDGIFCPPIIVYAR